MIDSSTEREILEMFVERENVQKTTIERNDDVQKTLRIENDLQFLIKFKKKDFDNNVNRRCRDEYQISKKCICDCIDHRFRIRFISCSICDRVKTFESEKAENFEAA